MASNKDQGFTGTRPTKELTKQFCDLIVEGVTLDVVCDFLGVSQSQCSIWIAKGKSYNAGPEESDPKSAPYGEFEAALRKAAAEYNIKMVKRVHTVEKGWMRDLAILERRDRKNYGRYEGLGAINEHIDPDQKYA